MILVILNIYPQTSIIPDNIEDDLKCIGVKHVLNNQKKFGIEQMMRIKYSNFSRKS